MYDTLHVMYKVDIYVRRARTSSWIKSDAEHTSTYICNSPLMDFTKKNNSLIGWLNLQFK